MSFEVIQGAVPPPSETPAKVVVSGRTSTAIDIKVVKTGQEIPLTCAGKKIANTPGFEWYVSEHYALKSQMDEKFSQMMLEISELAFAHWEEMTGLIPPDLKTTRMCIVYAKNMDELNRSIKSDFGGSYKGEGGGITLWENMTSYNYLSGSLQYHLKDLVIHENLHMLQGVVLKHNMGTEGFTYGGAQHVYDSNKKQLTVMVFDQAPTNHHTDNGIASLQKEFKTMQDMAANHWDEGGGLGAVYSHFFWNDPDRWFKWCIWRDEFYLDKVNQKTNVEMMEEIFGSLEKLNVEWEKWVKSRRVTFHRIDWGWEQNGNVIWAYGFPWDKNYWSQMNIQHAPIEKVVYDPMRMDYPLEPMPPIVGPVKRGVEEPSIGFVISNVGGSCWGGFGLGVKDRSMCQVIIISDKALVIEGKELPPNQTIERKEFALTEEIKEAAKKDAGRYGVTIQIKKDRLEVTIKAGAELKTMTASVPITATLYDRLMNGYMAMIGKDGYPAFIPFIDDGRQMEPDLSKPAPANRWRFPAEKEVYALYRAAWRLKDKAPASLIELKEAMLKTVDKEASVQNTALQLYKTHLPKVIDDIKQIEGSFLALKELF